MKQFLIKCRSISEQWLALTMYQRFESLVALLLRAIISLIIIMTLYNVIVAVMGGLVFGALNPLEPKIFQTVFGDILTVLIALEFNHTFHYIVTREQSVIQTKMVLLISLLALARKFIILDVTETTPNQLFGLAAVTLALGITYWLIRERDDRLFPSQVKRHDDTSSTPTQS
jgi:uncharacterized membrane protein (DUF373 family)